MKILFLMIFLTTLGISIFASGKYDSPIYTKKSNLALEGYDPVSFFESTEPMLGNTSWQKEYKGAIWYFSSEKNLILFSEDPEKYEPAYGGYCAWAMNNGKLAAGKPEHWDIIDSRLYLNYSSSTRMKFLNDLDSMILNADSKWPEIEAELLEEKAE
jgi:YHS domain-containing protein